MNRPLSNDLREPLSVRSSEISCHDDRRRRIAAWGSVLRSGGCSVCCRTGIVSPGKIGGYRPKKLSGRWRTWLLDRCRSGDFTLRVLVAELAERGLKVDYRVAWEFVHTEKFSQKRL